MFQWSLANRLGILRDSTERVWHAGHVNDVLELSVSSVLVASDGGGVWQLESSFGLPLSLDWPSGDTRALASIPDAPNWVLAAGSGPAGEGFVFTTDPNAALPLWTWRPVDVPVDLGVVSSIVVSGNHVVLATLPSPVTGLGGGLWTSAIPEISTPTAFLWQHAAGVAASARVTGLAPGPSDTLMVAADGTLGVGTWSGDLLDVNPSVIEDVDEGALAFAVLASSPSSPEVGYACSSSLAIDAMLRTPDGGRTWALVSAKDQSTGLTIVDHSQYGYTGAIAVSPHDPDVVVIGYTKGPWISVDGAQTFFPAPELSHDDHHRFRFTQSGRLYEATDGGVFFTDDIAQLRSGAAVTGLQLMQSALNQHLANLQFLGPSGVRDWWGRTNGSVAIPGLIGGGLQDNNDVYCLRWAGGATTPWYAVPAPWMFDGQALFFLADGSTIFTYGDSRNAHWAASPPRLTEDSAPIPVRNGKPGITYIDDGLPSGPLALVRFPDLRSPAGELLCAVAAAGPYGPPAGSPPGTPGPPYTPDVYGLFRDARGAQHWDYLVTLPLEPGSVVSAIACGSGHRILVGTRGTDQVWSIDCESDFALTPSDGLPADPGWTHYVADIAFLPEPGSLEAYSLYNSESIGEGEVAGALYYTSNGVHWDRLATSGLPLEALYCLLVLPGPGPTLCVATDTCVYVSTDGGLTWVSDSHGLPGRPHCSDLFEVEMPNGRHFIYLSTFGWSVWVAEIPIQEKFQKTPVLYHYPYLYPDDAPRPATRYRRLNEMDRPRLNALSQPMKSVDQTHERGEIQQQQ